LIVDREPWILKDGLAVALLGDLADDLIASHRGARTAEVLGSMRVAMTTRSRYAEDRLAEAVVEASSCACSWALVSIHSLTAHGWRTNSVS
jgi:hypothetical protein